MKATVYKYPLIIRENYLDFFGHVNNTAYLTLFEEARWDFITKNGYGLARISESGLGPVVLEVTMRFQKELHARDEIIIESTLTAYERKIGKLSQKMKRGDEVCCSAEFTIGLFHLKERKLALPTPDWLNAIGINSSN